MTDFHREMDQGRKIGGTFQYQTPLNGGEKTLKDGQARHIVTPNEAGADTTAGSIFHTARIVTSKVRG